MIRSARASALAYAALAAAAAVALVIGCANSADVEDPDAEAADAAADASKSAARDARGAREDDGEDPDTKDAGGDDVDAAKDASVDAAKDAGVDAAKDAGVDAAKDAGDDADAGSGDAGSGGDAGSALPPSQGEVVISEVMYNPSGDEPDTEWIEIHNTTSEPRSLSGLVLEDGANRTHEIGPGLVIAPGAYVVLASMQAAAVAAKVPAGAIVYEYNAGAATQIQLANGTNGAIVLLDGTKEIARAKYGSGSSSAANGQSIQLKVLTYDGAGAKANWCYSPNAWTTGSDKGTPGAPSDCPP